MQANRMPIESAKLRRLMCDQAKRIQFTGHSRLEMKNDGLIEADIRHVLANGSVTWTETKKDLLWHVEGFDVDGRRIRVVIAPNEIDLKIKIITAMTLKST